MEENMRSAQEYESSGKASDLAEFESRLTPEQREQIWAWFETADGLLSADRFEVARQWYVTQSSDGPLNIADLLHEYP
jgi:hypothetical protein